MKTNKFKDNSIYIGDNNKIKNSNIGCNNQNNNTEKKTMGSKLLWKFLIPITIAVISAAICIWLGLD